MPLVDEFILGDLKSVDLPVSPKWPSPDILSHREGIPEWILLSQVTWRGLAGALASDYI